MNRELEHFHGVRKRGKVKILMLSGSSRCKYSLLCRSWSPGILRKEAVLLPKGGRISDSSLEAGGPQGFVKLK